jgi:hypothetical protein
MELVLWKLPILVGEPQLELHWLGDGKVIYHMQAGTRGAK